MMGGDSLDGSRSTPAPYPSHENGLPQVTKDPKTLLRNLPGVDRLLDAMEQDPSLEPVPKSVRREAARAVLEALRRQILGSAPPPAADLDFEAVLSRVRAKAHQTNAPNLVPLVNATGIVIHTNLGRSLLAREAIESMAAIAGRYSNLEYDLTRGRRGSRYSAVTSLLCEITGAEAAMVVNNNAGAVLLSLATVADGREVVVSRGELVEIGGSFRIPDVMARSGAILREVGATNRTHLRDYRSAIGDRTGLLLKVHTSNFSIVGFSSAVSTEALVALGIETGIPVMEDLGSGILLDLSLQGLEREPMVQEAVAAGADIVTFSGDKLLGGPQAGIIVGKAAMIARIQSNPVNRALRIDKLTLTALESTLRLYRDPRSALERIPTLRMLTLPEPVIDRSARRLEALLTEIGDPRLKLQRQACISKAGGGSLPLLELPSHGVAATIEGRSANQLERALRALRPPIIGRIENDRFLMDCRTLRDEDHGLIRSGFETILGDIAP
jgi:L-seryl-tRNA(Ser) seleniumtransferase